MSASSDRFAAIIHRATGVRIDPTYSAPVLVGDHLRFVCPLDDAMVIAAAFVAIHGVDRSGVGLEYLDADADLLPSAEGATDACVDIFLPVLASRLATLTGGAP